MKKCSSRTEIRVEEEGKDFGFPLAFATHKHLATCNSELFTKWGAINNSLTTKNVENVEIQGQIKREDAFLAS